MPTIYAIILNWNKFEDTVACVESLKKSKVPFSKIIVIDQASPDGSGEKLEEHFRGDALLAVIRNEVNLGFAKAVNAGIRRALDDGAGRVFLINNDTVVDSDCIQHLDETLEVYPQAAAAGPAIMYYSDAGRIWQAGGYFNKIKMGVSAPAQRKRICEIDQSVSRVTFLTGCAVLIPRQTFEQVGLFDEDYFFYSEDVDYCLRIVKSGMNMYLVPRARVLHKIDDIATDRTSPFVLYHLAKSTMLVMRKQFSGLEQVYGILLLCTVYTAFRFWQILIGKKKWKSGFSWFRGLFDGMKAKVSI